MSCRFGKIAWDNRVVLDKSGHQCCNVTQPSGPELLGQVSVLCTEPATVRQ